MYSIDESDYLEHYGRKGMKWYQHIFGDKDARYARKEKRINRKVAKIDKKKAKQLKLSDKQLKKIYKLNKELQSLTTGAEGALHKLFGMEDDPYILDLRDQLGFAKEDRDQTLLEIQRLDGLISKQYAKLDKAKIKYGKMAVDEVIDDLDKKKR